MNNMDADRNWTAVNDHLEGLRAETATRRLLKLHPAPARQQVRANIWARLLPALRRLEGWLERHAGTVQAG